MPKASTSPPATDTIPADSTAPNAADAPAKSFEAALAELLEKLVAKMESGSLSLEQSLTAHRRGLELAKFCQGLLARAEQQVKVLEADTLRAFPSGRAGEDDDA